MQSVLRSVRKHFDDHPLVFAFIYLTIMLIAGAVFVGLEQAGLEAVHGAAR